jgi:hypothetical protein
LSRDASTMNTTTVYNRRADPTMRGD